MDQHPIFVFIVKLAVITILFETAEMISRIHTTKGVKQNG